VSAASPSAAPGRRPASRRKGPGRAARGERREQLLGAIGASPGARPSELAAAIGIRPTQVSVLIAKLRGERLIVKDGKGYALKS
jgi:predicted transcriptional regulator